MELIDLYKEDNKDLLYCICWLNKNSIFDKSIGTFKDIDLFTFLENINKFDFDNDTYFDDVYYILEYTQDSILHLLNNINKEIKREHKIVPISQAKEYDKKCVLWISKQNGRTLKEKLSNGKIKSVQRYRNIDTYENRIFKKFLISLLKVYEKRNDLSKFEELFFKIHNWLRSDDSKNIDEYGKIVYNNILLHHPHYSKIFKSYKLLYNLNEKLEHYKINIDTNLLFILIFDILSKLQYRSDTLLLPDNIVIDHERFKINFEQKWLVENINLLSISIEKKELYFKNIPNLVKSNIKNQLSIELHKNRTFALEDNIKEVFIDIFRLFPVANINNKIINFPITLKQKIDEKIINANNTKIIDLNHEIHTLPELLDTYNTDILKYFLEDFSDIFNKAKLNYIIPDYVNVFEFTDSKRMINSYFKNNKPIPKSILAGLQYLFSNNVKKDDTLIYIQRNHHNELYVTTLLVKYDNNLKDITDGYYLERYPTKKINLFDDGLLKSLNNIFDEESSKIFLNKFLQNGLKGIKKEGIVFYQDENIIDLSNLDIPLKVYDDIEKIKSLYTTKNLFKSNYEYLNDTNEENLINFEKLLQYEKQGYNLWREHLPDLLMEIQEDGWWKQFTLVDETSELIEKTVKIENHFVIPSGVKELSFPLIFGDEKINYKAYLSSKDFPYTQNIECLLNLTYDFERENPYELIFKPINKEFKEIHVEWKHQTYNDIELPIPNYPQKKSWEEFTRDPKRDGSGYSDLLDWILERLVLLEDLDAVPKFIIEKELKKIQKPNKSKGYFQWGKYDKNGEYFCFVEVDGEKVFCHSKSFKEDINFNEFYEGMIFYLNVKQNTDGTKTGRAITFTDISEEVIIKKLKKEYSKRPLEDKLIPIMNGLRSLSVPLKKVWNDHSLLDIDVPNDFRVLMYKYIDLSTQYIINPSIPNDFKKSLIIFLSHLHKDIPNEISNILVNNSVELKYPNSLAYSLGDCTKSWQNDILNNILLKLSNKNYHSEVIDILAISLWRSEKLVYHISEADIIKILKILPRIIAQRFSNMQKNQSDFTKRRLIKVLELLLSILRVRRVYKVLNPSSKVSLIYLEAVDFISKYYLQNRIHLDSRIQLDIVKPESFVNVPNLLYALRVYLTADTGAANSIKVLGVSDD